MSNFYDVTIERTVDDTVKNYQIRVAYDSSSLIISEIKTDQTGTESVTPFIVQLWKCLPDGSRQNFVDQTDAFAWFESDIKNTLF